MDTHPDVLVVGGGIAGIAAACAAAARHAHVMLIEHNAYPGGKATAAFVGTLCGAYLNGNAPESSYFQHGFTADFVDQLAHMSAQRPVHHQRGLWFLPYERDAFLALSNTLLSTHGVHVLYNTDLTGLTCDGGKIQSAEFSSCGKKQTLFPRYIIDASGHAATSQLTTVETITSEVYQAAAQVFEWKNLNNQDEFSCSLTLNRHLRQGIENKFISADYRRISLIPGTYRQNSAFFKLGIAYPVGDDPDEQQKASKIIRDALQQITQYLRSASPEFTELELGFIAPEIGVRTGPRNKGKYILTEQDVLTGKKHPTFIARGAWPVEFWHFNKNPEFHFLMDSDWYEIPAESIESDRFSNLFFCGRTLSAEEKAIASARVMGICLQTGYAAGVLAAGQLHGRSRQQDMETLQALFPNPPA